MIILPVAILAMPEGYDRQYMEILYRQKHRLMFATAWRYFNTPAEVEDVVSDSCLALIKNLPTIRGLECNKLNAYIVSIVKNTAINHINARRRRERVFSNVDDEAVMDTSDGLNVERKVELEEELEQVTHAIEQLSQNERDVMRMKYFMEMDDEAIARETGLSVNSIRQYVVRARKHIKAALYAD